MNASGPPGACRKHDTHHLHALAPGSCARPWNGPEALSRIRLVIQRLCRGWVASAGVGVVAGTKPPG
jgi:hypothetical protein